MSADTGFRADGYFVLGLFCFGFLGVFAFLSMCLRLLSDQAVAAATSRRAGITSRP